MYLSFKRPNTLLLLCAALCICILAGSGEVHADDADARPSVQELHPEVSADKPLVPGFSPYPEFINGHSPGHPVVPPQQLAVQCVSEQQCSNPETAGKAGQALDSQSAPAAPEPHAAAESFAEHIMQKPAPQQTIQQEQQLPETVQQSAEQQAAVPTSSTPQPQTAPAATAATPVQQTAPASSVQEPAAVALPDTLGDQKAPPATSPVRRLLNLALLSDGASVLAANPEAKRPERAIDKDIDSFMKNDCSADKWLIIELSQLGTVETIKLTMKELYSSRVHTFRVLGRSSHPRKDGPDLTASIKIDAWQLLGSFTAENKRGTQSFSLPQRSRVRYILLMFDTHYGSEVMCAMNMIEVLGVSAAQELEEALAMQEELEAEELFQHLQQQQEQEEQMQAQQRQPQQQPQQQQLAITTGCGAGTAQAGAPGTASPVAAEQQQPATPAPQQVAQQQLESPEVPSVSSSQVHEDVQQQVAQHVPSGVDSSSSKVADVQTVAHVDETRDAAGITPESQDPAGGSSSSSGSGSVGHPSQPQLPAVVKPLGTDQDVIAVPVADTPVQKPNDGSSTVNRSPSSSASSGRKVHEQLLPSTGVQQGPTTATGSTSTAAAGSLAHAVSPAGPATGHLPVEQLLQQQPQQQAAVQQAIMVPAAAAAGQADTKQPSIVAPHSANETSGTAQGPGGAAAAAAIASGAQPDTAVDGRTPVAVGIEVPAPAETASGSKVPAATAQPAAAVKPANGQAAAGTAAVQQPPAGQQQQPSLQQQQQQHNSPSPVAQQQTQQKSQQPAREPVLAGGTAKPKQAGNLFDIIKSEMMQLKLEQGKVSKKLDGLSRRGSEYETLAGQLQQQQVQLLAQLEALSSKVGQLAEQVARVEVVHQYNTHHHHHHHTAAGPHSNSSPVGGRPHPHAAHSRHGMHVATGPGHPGASFFSTCHSGVIAVPLLLYPQYQWLVVGVLAGSAVLGVLVLFLHPSSSKLSSGLRFGIGALSFVNVLLAVLLGVYLVVLGLFKGHQRVYEHAMMYETILPEYRMIGNGSI